MLYLFGEEKPKLFCSTHATAFIRKSLIMLSEYTLQMDSFILDSSGLQWIPIKLILKNHTHIQTPIMPTQLASTMLKRNQ